MTGKKRADKICVYLHGACYLFCLLFLYAPVFAQDTIAPVKKPETPAHITYTREVDIDNLNTQEQTFDSSLASFHRSRGFLYDITKERNIFMTEMRLHERVVNFSDDITLPYKFSENT